MSHRRSVELHFAKRAALSVLAVAIVVMPIIGGVMTPTYANGPQDAFERIYGIDGLRMEFFESRSARPPRHVDGMELFQPGQTIRSSIAPAYQVQPKQVVDAPAWIDTVRYDKYIGGSGLAPEGIARVNQYALLERRLLAERFALKFHREMRLQSVYVLSIADRGRTEALRELAPLNTGEPVKQSIEPGAPEKLARLMLAAPAHHFAFMLSRELDSVVLDRTGLTGLYRFELPADAKTDALAEVLESRLGLKLTRSTEQVEMLVVDSIQQPRARVAATPAPAQPFVGERVNLQFKNHDLRDITGVFQKITGRRIVVHPSINEKVTINIIDAPWDEALARVVASKGLSMRREGDAIYIDPAPPRVEAVPAPQPTRIISKSFSYDGELLRLSNGVEINQGSKVIRANAAAFNLEGKPIALTPLEDPQ